ncbi:Alpha/Beta hydrolase fold [Arabidopsis thaliana x Arabidopsis arenosa]|uniref:Carboxypeptidase n=1 Tax=Arabidopsis thaliana x Arabidopsis arenosa TaxID=1240361 RepID=A0A8T1XF29_9BRAS|nr:Alpha/Beta hydrolase fold [Arabidopsis thaliana x Arabidopsis arenosa]
MVIVSLRNVAMVIVVVLVAVKVFAQGYPEADLVVRLPDQPKVAFRQYAGYVDLDLNVEPSLFYYFFEAEKHPETKPLTLWLNGGPGCSSVGGGAFTELGPFYPTGYSRGLRINSMPWNRASNMLFVESPAGVGWSYSNQSSDYNSGDKTTASDMLVFLLRWFDKFPELISCELFLTGESYAGHYIPQLANATLNYNSHSSGFKFNMKGIPMGNPLLKLDREIAAAFEFFCFAETGSRKMVTPKIQQNWFQATNMSMGVDDNRRVAYVMENIKGIDIFSDDVSGFTDSIFAGIAYVMRVYICVI